MTSAGWAACDWITEHLRLPDGSPFVLTDPEVEFVVAWYEVDEHGRFVHRRGLLMWPKGAGKSPTAAALALFEFAGPAVFDGFDAQGEPVGKPHPVPWVQVAAVSEDQATSNVYSVIWAMLEMDHGRAADALGIDWGKTRLFRKDSPGAKLESVTASAGSREGQRLTAGFADETWLWTPQNGGRKLAEVLRRNAGKTGGRVLETSNAYILGSESVAETTANEAQEGRPGILFVSTTPAKPPTEDMSDAELREVLESVYPGATWIDFDRIVEEIRDPANPWSESSRFFFNTPAPGSASAVSPKDWDLLAAPGTPADGDVWAAFVGSDTSAALVGCSEVEGKPHLFPIGIWNEPGQRVPRKAVHAAVERMVDTFNVVAFYVDPRDWVDEAEDWADRYAEREDEVLSWPTTSRARFGPALDAFLVAVKEQTITHADDPALTAAVEHAVLRPSGDTMMLAPAGPGRRIEAARAAVAALRAHSERPRRAPKQFMFMDDEWRKERSEQGLDSETAEAPRLSREI